MGGHEVNTSTDLGTFTRECGGAGTMGRKIDAPRSFHRRQNGLQAGTRRGRKLLEVSPERTFCLLKLAHDAPESRLWIWQPLQLSI